MKMLVSEYIRVLNIALNGPSQYATGAFGAPTGYKNNTERYAKNSSAAVAKKIRECADGTFMFDCKGYIVMPLWGWSADPNALYGGAVYKGNDVPDFSIKSIQKHCSDWKEDGCPQSALTVGEWMRTKEKDHVGVYAGAGMVLNSTARGDCKVQLTKLSDRDWSGHGKSIYIEYPEKKPEIVCPCCGARFILE